MKIKIKMAAITLAALAALPVRAEFWDGNALLQRIDGNSYEQAYATGFIIGVADAFNELTFCPPPNARVTVGQVHQIVTKYLRANPEKLHFTAQFLVSRSLSTAFPCKPPEKSGPNL